MCEQQTSWTLDKTTNTEKLNDPDDTPFSFTVTVTEGPMEQTLTATGQIIITNSGDQTPSLASVAVLLEDLTPGAGDVPGPSGNNWKVLRVTAESEAAACGSSAVVCDRSGSRTIVQDAGSNLILFNCDDMNDVIALSDAV